MTSPAIFSGPNGSAALQQFAHSFGLSPDQAAPIVNTLTDELSARMQRLMLSRGGIADLTGLLTSGTPSAPAELPGAIAQGNEILNVLVGDKHLSRGIAARTSAFTGIDVETAKKMLPVVAELMLGQMRAQAKPQLQQIAEKLPAFGLGNNNTGSWDGAAPAGQAAPSGGPISGGGRLPIPGDNIPGLGRQRSAPSNNPFDQLPDIIRRGGVRIPGGSGDGPVAGGGALENIIRSILGSLLGTGNTGVIGTMVRLFLLRFITNLVRRMLGGR